MFIFCKGNNYLSLRNFIYSILVSSLFLLTAKKAQYFLGIVPL
ncbi:hypothetical protein CAPSP0001_0964 [Capnocytophaga sputigena ATCC 33612]|nr:hypothetical protein CAPSP0001_0964 [Capnocytophaga sputigena ATCC 33612]